MKVALCDRARSLARTLRLLPCASTASMSAAPSTLLTFHAAPRAAAPQRERGTFYIQEQQQQTDRQTYHTQNSNSLYALVLMVGKHGKTGGERAFIKNPPSLFSNFCDSSPRALSGARVDLCQSNAIRPANNKL